MISFTVVIMLHCMRNFHPLPLMGDRVTPEIPSQDAAEHVPTAPPPSLRTCTRGYESRHPSPGMTTCFKSIIPLRYDPRMTIP